VTTFCRPALCKKGGEIYIRVFVCAARCFKHRGPTEMAEHDSAGFVALSVKRRHLRKENHG